MKKIFFLSAILFISCSSSDNKNIVLKRTFVNKNPVKEYSEKVPDSLNDWYYKVQLFETDSTFNYLVKMQYKEVTGEQIIHIPNLGYEPKPELKKGYYDKTVMVGFLDDKGKFMDYKMVYVVDGQLGIRSVKRYTVNDKD
ncbi:MAG: hypothetical protein HY252_00135 [Sphingobacteriales bacterium]|nr:hypothetical protein [Sphingobacteriales bacterium]